MTELRQRQPRIRDEGYLKWLRKQSCACGCGKPAPSDAAHLRAGSIAYGKEYPGLGAKPSDCWAMPLNRSCHMRQHAYGDELGFWAAHGVPDPFGRSMRYYAAYQAECPSKPADASSASRPRKSKVRAKPHHEPRAARQRAKIAKRANPWPKGRKFR
jgi:hypothetical protein